MSRTARVACLGLLALACASSPSPDAAGSIDWAAVANEQVPRIVTVDADGQERVTKLWLVVVDGQGYIRTSDTRWFKNIQRDPDVRFRVGGATYPMRATLERNEATRKRVNQAFRDKYGFSDRWIGWFSNRDASNILRLDSPPA